MMQRYGFFLVEAIVRGEYLSFLCFFLTYVNFTVFAHNLTVSAHNLFLYQGNGISGDAFLSTGKA